MSLWRPQGPPWNEIRRHDIKVHNCCYWIPLHFRDSKKEVAYILSSSPRIYWPQDKMDKWDGPWLPGPALLDAGSPWLSWCLAPGSCWPLCTLTVLLSDWTRRRNVLFFPFCKWGMEWYVRPRFWRYLQIFKFQFKLLRIMSASFKEGSRVGFFICLVGFVLFQFFPVISKIVRLFCPKVI